MKLRSSFAVIGAILLLLLLATAVRAQDEPPAPYAGLKNPSPWGDTSAQEAGKELYRQSCLGCHGVKGDNLAVSNFSAKDYPQRLEKRPDYYFWVLSEGRMNKGMPSYKASLSDGQRWQVVSYLWSLGAETVAASSPSQPNPAEMSGSLLLAAPQQTQSGEPLTLKVTLQDNQGKPIANALVRFFLKVDFFTNGLMEIGKATTDSQGMAVLKYTPRLLGEVEVIARYGASETATTISLTDSIQAFYHPEAGIRLPAPGREVFLGPVTALQLGEMGAAPATALRLPGGILSWLLLLLATVGLIWLTYFRIIYQVFRIPIVSEIRDIDTRLVPLAGLAIVVFLGILLILMLLTGPYTHLHLPR